MWNFITFVLKNKIQRPNIFNKLKTNQIKN